MSVYLRTDNYRWMFEMRRLLRERTTLTDDEIDEYCAEGLDDYWRDGYSPEEALEEDMTYWGGEPVTGGAESADGAHGQVGSDQRGGAGPK